MGKKKEDEGFKPEKAKEPISADSPEVVEAVAKFQEEQQAEITDLMDEAYDEDAPAPQPEPEADMEASESKTPSDHPAKAEQESQPEAQDSEKATEAKAEEQPKADETPATDTDVPETSTEQEQTQETQPEYLTGESYDKYQVEIVTEDGAKQVPLSNLVTTYGKYPQIQRKYQELKPVMDLAQKANVQVNQVLPLLELGIQTYAREQGIVQGHQPPVDGTMRQPRELSKRIPWPISRPL